MTQKTLQKNLTQRRRRATRLLKQNRRTKNPDRTCRVCGCTEYAACPEGCYWVEQHLCSSCQ